MNDEELEAKYGPLVKQYQDKIETLSGFIYKLEDVKRDLDTKIAKHQANSININETEVKLTELLKEIEARKGIMSTTTEEMNKLIVKKSTLEQEIEQLNFVVTQKKNYVADIDKLQRMIVLLQKEMEQFQDNHSENKKKAEDEMTNIKKAIVKLHADLASIISNH